MMLFYCIVILLTTCYAHSMEEQQEKKIKVIITTTYETNHDEKSIKLQKELALKKVETFHQSLESPEHFPTASLTLLEQYPVLAVMPRAFSMDIPLTTLLKTIKKQSFDEDSLKEYMKLATLLIAHNIKVHKEYEVTGSSPNVMISLIATLLGAHNKLARALYQSVEDNLITKETPESIFNAFSDRFNKCQLLEFFEKRPLWLQKTDAYNNTPLLLCLKNFSDTEEDFLLLKFLITYCPEYLFKYNDNNEDPFTEAAGFTAQEKLFAFIRATVKYLSTTYRDKKLTNKLFKALRKGSYKKAEDIIKTDPTLCFACDDENQSVVSYLKTVKISELITSTKSEFESLLKIVRNLIPEEKVKNKGFFNALRKKSRVTVESIKEFQRRFSIAPSAHQEKKNNTINNFLEKEEEKDETNDEETLNEINIQYQQKNFKSNFTFGEKKKN